jgi:hypothetical protein
MEAQELRGFWSGNTLFQVPRLQVDFDETGIRGQGKRFLQEIQCACWSIRCRASPSPLIHLFLHPVRREWMTEWKI